MGGSGRDLNHEDTKGHDGGSTTISTIFVLFASAWLISRSPLCALCVSVAKDGC